MLKNIFARIQVIFIPVLLIGQAVGITVLSADGFAGFIHSTDNKLTPHARGHTCACLNGLLAGIREPHFARSLVHQSYIKVAVTEIQFIIIVFLYQLIFLIDFLAVIIYLRQSVKHLVAKFKCRQSRYIGESVR